MTFDTTPVWEIPTITFDYESAVMAWEARTAGLMAQYSVPWSGVDFAGVEGGGQ